MHLLPPRTFDHPDLGRLTRRYGAWRGATELAGRQIAISARSGWRRPEDTQLELLAAVLGDLGAFDRAALEFARAELHPDRRAEQQLADVDFDPRTMELIGVEVGFAVSGRRGAAALPPRTPIFTLQFALPGDRNVVDVVFLDGEPVEVDYH